MKSPYTRGFSLAEAMVAIAVITSVFLALIIAYNKFVTAAIDTQPVVKVSYLLEEGVEAVKSLRDISWNTKIAALSTTTTYYLTFSTSTAVWSATTSLVSGYVDATYLRSFTLTDVNRDATTKDISAVGVYDPGTKKLTVNVSWWSHAATTTRTLTTYITNLFSN